MNDTVNIGVELAVGVFLMLMLWPKRDLRWKFEEPGPVATPENSAGCSFLEQIGFMDQSVNCNCTERA